MHKFTAHVKLGNLPKMQFDIPIMRKISLNGQISTEITYGTYTTCTETLKSNGNKERFSSSHNVKKP